MEMLASWFGWLVVVAVSLGILLFWDWWSKRYWTRRRIPQVEAESIFHINKFIASLNVGLPRACELYQSCDVPLLGFYKGRRPVLMVRDPRLVCTVLKGAFQHFTDKRHPIKLDKNVEPLSQHLIGLTGSKWKAVRSNLTPVFSSGKIKEALPLIEEALDSLLASIGDEPVDIYAANVTLVSDVILSYAFGLEKNAAERDLVRSMGLRSILTSPKISFKRALRFYFPRLFGFLGIRAFDPAVTSFFVSFAREALAGSKQHSTRADFLGRLLKMANSINEDEREGLLAAQVFSFFVAGFETTCFTLSMCLFELCKHPHVAAKARLQLDHVLHKHGTFTYDAIQEATYIQQILKECMRLYSAEFGSSRICTKSYKFEGLGEELEVEEGTEVLIPSFCISRDSRFFPNPLDFDPDRFSAEKKGQVRPGTYIPFGEGPRQCIAVRFSMLEMEYILCRLVHEYDFNLIPGTPHEVEFDEYSKLTNFKGKIFILFCKRGNKCV